MAKKGYDSSGGRARQAPPAMVDVDQSHPERLADGLGAQSAVGVVLELVGDGSARAVSVSTSWSVQGLGSLPLAAQRAEDVAGRVREDHPEVGADLPRGQRWEVVHPGVAGRVLDDQRAGQRDGHGAQGVLGRRARRV